MALIKGFVSTLRLEDANWDTETIQDSLQVIEEESDRLAELIENLLDATRFEAGGFKINRTDIFLPLLVQKLVIILKPRPKNIPLWLIFPRISRWCWRMRIAFDR